MKELNELLKHLNAYVYDKSSERINSSTADIEAVKCYKNSLAALGIHAIETEINSQFEHIIIDDEKWAFDIALDCLRTMSDDDKDYITKNPDPIDYHFGYGTGIRNKYIHPAKKHFVLRPDSVSSRVLEIIIAILCEDYEYRSED